MDKSSLQNAKETPLVEFYLNPSFDDKTGEMPTVKRATETVIQRIIKTIRLMFSSLFPVNGVRVAKLIRLEEEISACEDLSYAMAQGTAQAAPDHKKLERALSAFARLTVASFGSGETGVEQTLFAPGYLKDTGKEDYDRTHPLRMLNSTGVSITDKKVKDKDLVELKTQGGILSAHVRLYRESLRALKTDSSRLKVMEVAQRGKTLAVHMLKMAKLTESAQVVDFIRP